MEIKIIKNVLNTLPIGITDITRKSDTLPKIFVELKSKIALTNPSEIDQNVTSRSASSIILNFLLSTLLPMLSHILCYEKDIFSSRQIELVHYESVFDFGKIFFPIFVDKRIVLSTHILIIKCLQSLIHNSISESFIFSIFSKNLELLKKMKNPLEKEKLSHIKFLYNYTISKQNRWKEFSKISIDSLKNIANGRFTIMPNHPYSHTECSEQDTNKVTKVNV